MGRSAKFCRSTAYEKQKREAAGKEWRKSAKVDLRQNDKKIKAEQKNGKAEDDEMRDVDEEDDTIKLGGRPSKDKAALAAATDKASALKKKGDRPATKRSVGKVRFE